MTTPTDWRALCAELLAMLDAQALRDPEMDGGLLRRRARTALAQPEPEGVTDEELYQFWESHPELGLTCDEPVKLLRAGLTHFARPTIKPVPVAERLPGPEDCDAEGRCWWFCPAAILPSGQCAYWCLAPADGSRSWFTHWLPHHALPLPQPH
jgi:hypothetical protein